MKSLLRGAVLAGAGLAGYGYLEHLWYRLVTREVPVFGPRPELSILHVADTHMAPRHRRMRRFLESLPERIGAVPDLVVLTGDVISGNDAIEDAVAALGPLPARYGKLYVLGSHDYFLPRFEGYLKYFSGRKEKIRAPRADTARLEGLLREHGWKGVINSSARVETPAGPVRVTGVADPYLGWHKTEHIKREPDDLFAIGLVHSPDVVSPFLLEGFDLVLAGHTHGGQVRAPLIGALVTNSSLPTALAAGLHRIGNGWLFVSPGLGTGKYAPLRLNCRPEVTLLRLVSRVGDHQ
jgi:predicted MPP superfamily phosphohydrolase